MPSAPDFKSSMDELRALIAPSAGGPPIEPPRGGGQYSGMPSDLPSRVSVLEQIAKETSETLKGIRTDLKDGRDKQERDFRISIAWTFTMTCVVIGIIAKGFHWI